jgi:hypothetical protein
MPSSVVRSFRYDPVRRVLTVRFVNGRVYLYADVPASVYLGLRAAESKGRFFNTHIRDVYRFRAQSAA